MIGYLEQTEKPSSKYFVELVIYVGCWLIWLSQNDIVFDKQTIQSCMYVLLTDIHWTGF